MHNTDNSTQKLVNAKEYFSKDLFATATTGIEILEADTNYAKCSLKLSDKHTNAEGHIMGGAIYTLADFAFAVAANNGQDIKTVTVSNNIKYLSPVKGTSLTATATLVRKGTHLSTFEINVYDNLSNHIAFVSTLGMQLTK